MALILPAVVSRNRPKTEPRIDARRQKDSDLDVRKKVSAYAVEQCLTHRLLHFCSIVGGSDALGEDSRN